MDNQKPRIDLKQHQRFRRHIPWGLIRKLAIVAVLGGMIYYLVTNTPVNQQNKADDDGIEVEID